MSFFVGNFCGKKLENVKHNKNCTGIYITETKPSIMWRRTAQEYNIVTGSQKHYFNIVMILYSDTKFLSH